MPLYEYLADDGTRLELIRPIDQADAPVPDPEHKGRSFKRVFSSFATRGGAPAASGGTGGGCCPCGKNSGQCSRN